MEPVPQVPKLIRQVRVFPYDLPEELFRINPLGLGELPVVGIEGRVTDLRFEPEDGGPGPNEVGYEFPR